MSNVLNMVSEESFIAQTEKIVKAIKNSQGNYRRERYTVCTCAGGNHPSGG